MAYEDTREDIEKTLAEFRLERDYLNRLITGYEKALEGLNPPAFASGGIIRDDRHPNLYWYDPRTTFNQLNRVGIT